MAVKHENAYVESVKFANNKKAELAEREAKAIQERADKINDWKNKYYAAKDNREQRERLHGRMLESARDGAFADVLKAIYITALENYSGLTSEEYFLAESLVERWIQENNGAKAILGKYRNKTYLLNRISEIVESAAQRTVKEAESINEDGEEDDDKEKTEEKVEDKKEDSEEDEEDYSDEIDGMSDDEESEDETESDTEEDSEVEDDSEEDSEDEEDSDESGEDAEDTEVSDDDSEGGDESEDDIEIDLDDESDEEDSEDISDEEDKEIEDEILDDDDNEDEDDEDSESDQIFKDLQDEQDVKKAIDTIQTRVADAEEKFIQRNAEDKKKVDELLHKINNSVKTVEEIDDKDDPKSQVEEEHVRMWKRQINEITDKGAKTVFESMANEISKSIYLNENARTQYENEDGQIDTDAVVGRVRVMYGFLETLNTLQFEDINSDYVKSVIENINA